MPSVTPKAISGPLTLLQDGNSCGDAAFRVRPNQRGTRAALKISTRTKRPGPRQAVASPVSCALLTGDVKRDSGPLLRSATTALVHSAVGCHSDQEKSFST